MQTPRPAPNRSKTSASKLCFTDFVRRSHGCGTISRFHIDKRTSVRHSRRPASIDHRRAPGPGVSRGDRHDRGRPVARSRARHRVGGRAAAGKPCRRVLRARARGQPGCRNGARRARHRRAGSRRRNRGRLEGRGRRARPQGGRREHALGDARAAENRPHRLPVADRALRRSRSGVLVRSDEGGARRGEGARRDALRRPRRLLFARRRALQLRRVPEALPSDGSGARSARPHRPRSGYGAAGPCAAGARARRDLTRAFAQFQGRPRDAESRHGDVRRALRVVQVGTGRGSHVEPRGVPVAAPMSMWLIALVGLAFVLVSEPALALRPYDSTDADVAKQGEFELELGPVERRREGSKRIAVAPAVIGNLGLEGNRELVIQGQREVALDREPGEPRSAIVDNGVFIKQVLRKGTLQDAAGPSVATEYGLLLPSVHGEKGTGLSVAGILSQRWAAATVHLNTALGWTREHEPDIFLGAILEGPYSWPVRPVAEFFTEQARGSARVNSGLIGAIWRVRDGLSFDAGLRSAQAGSEAIHELRLGLTWAFAFRKEP